MERRRCAFLLVEGDPELADSLDACSKPGWTCWTPCTMAWFARIRACVRGLRPASLMSVARMDGFEVLRLLR